MKNCIDLVIFGSVVYLQVNTSELYLKLEKNKLLGIVAVS